MFGRIKKPFFEILWKKNVGISFFIKFENIDFLQKKKHKNTEKSDSEN